MKNFTISLSILVSMYSFNGNAQYNHENLKIKRDAEHSNSSDTTSAHFDNSYQLNNLKLFPIVANYKFVDYNKDLGKFTLLKEAIEQNKIVITETGATIPPSFVH